VYKILEGFPGVLLGIHEDGRKIRKHFGEVEQQIHL
jgi:hypothetical protein